MIRIKISICSKGQNRALVCSSSKIFAIFTTFNYRIKCSMQCHHKGSFTLDTKGSSLEP